MQQALEAAKDEEALETRSVSPSLIKRFSPIIRSVVVRELSSRCGMAYNVDDDGREYGGRHGCPVLRILLAADELRVVAPEEEAEDRQDDDGEYRDDEATKASDVRCQRLPCAAIQFRRRHSPRPGLHRAHDRLHAGRRGRVGCSTKASDGRLQHTAREFDGRGDA